MGNKKRLVIILIIVLLLISVAGSIFMYNYACKPQSGGDIYYCDVKNFKLKTNIEITDEYDNYIGSVKGNILAIFEDPLRIEKDGENLCYASDDYNFFVQDNHGIYVNDDLVFVMEGKFKTIRDSYNIYDKDLNKIAYAKFSPFDASGKMYSVDGELIAEYRHFPLINDFTVIIYDNLTYDTNAVLMVFASYYSDKSYDAKNESNN